MKSGLLQKLRYQFDNSFSKGPIAVMAWLAVTILIVLFISALIIWVFDLVMDVEEKMTFGQAFYEGYYQVLSSGVIDWGSNPAFRWVMAILCLLGMVFVSIFIGLISSGIEGKIESLKRGRSKVLEQNHILIYGWSPKIFQVIGELISASENLKTNTIVLLADKDKAEMDDEINEKISDFKTSKVITRSGSTIDIDDINIVNPQEARSIIILPTDDENSDINVIKTLMALMNDSKKKKAYNIVTEINDPSKVRVAQILGKNEISVIQTGDVISRIMVQTCRQPGLSSVYNDLLAFEGNEIYFKIFPEFVGKKFGEIVYCFEKSVLIGVYQNEGKMLLNPPSDLLIAPSDRLIFIAVDDNLIEYTGDKSNTIDLSAIDTSKVTPPSNSPTLIIGWNDKVGIMLEELDNYVSAGAEVTILANKKEAKLHLEEYTGKLKNCKVNYVQGDTTDIDVLEKLEIKKYGHIILLCYDDTDIQDADARTLITLVHLRELGDRLGAKFNIVSEMKDVRNKALAELAKPDDFVISDNITSLVLCQICENRDLLDVLQDLFSSEGAEIYLKPITDYVKTGQTMNFYTVSKAAQDKGEIAIGYRIAAEAYNASKNYGVINNPSKSATVQFSVKDKLIIIAH